MEISAIILAAGNSSRLGRAKQLLQLNGKSLIHACIDKLARVGIQNPIIVLGAHFKEINNHVQPHFPQITIARNPDWPQGMSTSLQKGLTFLSPTCEAVLLCLSDQPLIPDKHLQEMISQYNSSGKLVVSTYNKDIGVPAIIPSQYFSELRKLSGKKGAKYLLKKYQQGAIEISCPEAAFDIDTEEDYRRIVEMN